MRAVVPLVLVAVAALGAQAPVRDAGPAHARTAAIHGRVLTIDGAPLRRAIVTLSGDERDPEISDDTGRFTFAALPPGRYTVRAEKTGYAPASFGERRPFDRAIPIVLAAGARADRVDIPLARGGAITGRVTDELGEPMVGATVAARSVGSTEQRRARYQAATQTDDLGEYRLGGLTAAEYIIEAFPFGNRETRFGDGDVLIFGFYPGMANVAQAQAVPVQAGEDTAGIDFTLRPGRRATVTIGATDTAGRPVDGQFSLTNTEPGNNSTQSARINDGWGWSSVAPGEWALTVASRDGTAASLLTVDSDDISLSFVLRPKGVVSGRFVFEGTTRSRMPSLAIEARASTPNGNGPQRATAQTRPDGTFTIANLAGAQRFALRGAPNGVFLKSLLWNGRDLLDGPVTFAGGEDWRDVVALVSNDPPTLRGTAALNGQRAVDYSVIVFPEDRARWEHHERLLRWARADQRGEFTVEDLPAGRYLAIALPAVDGAHWDDPRYLETLRPAATAFVLAERGATTLDLPILAAR